VLQVCQICFGAKWILPCASKAQQTQKCGALIHSSEPQLQQHAMLNLADRVRPRFCLRSLFLHCHMHTKAHTHTHPGLLLCLPPFWAGWRAKQGSCIDILMQHSPQLRVSMQLLRVLRSPRRASAALRFLFMTPNKRASKCSVIDPAAPAQRSRPRAGQSAAEAPMP